MSAIEYKRLAERVSQLENKACMYEPTALHQIILRSHLHRESVLKCRRRVMPNTIVITMSINYADKLAMSLRNNARMFKKLYVVTTESDTETVQICSKYRNVEIIYTQKINYDGAVFNKSAMIREAQERVHKQHPDSWILLLDADIVLPLKFPAIAKQASELDKDALYSMYRVDFHTKEDYLNRQNPSLYQVNFMGFFQMYYDKTKLYPTSSNNCSECDVTFSQMFHNKRMLSDFDCVYHLGKEADNWNGRVSEWWK